MNERRTRESTDKTSARAFWALRRRPPGLFVNESVAPPAKVNILLVPTCERGQEGFEHFHHADGVYPMNLFQENGKNKNQRQIQLSSSSRCREENRKRAKGRGRSQRHLDLNCCRVVPCAGIRKRLYSTYIGSRRFPLADRPATEVCLHSAAGFILSI